MTKNKILFAVLFAAMVLTGVPTCAEGAENPRRGIVMGDSVRMRVEPNTGAAIIRQFDKNTVVDVLDSRSMSGQYPWYQVRHAGDTGWMYGEFLKVAPSGAERALELPGEKEITLMLEGDEYTFAWKLAVSRYGYAIYLDPDYELSEADGFDLVAFRGETSPILNIRIYEVDPGAPAPKDKGLYGVTSMTEYQRYIVGDRIFEAEINYPYEAAGSGATRLRKMAETMTGLTGSF